MTRWEYRTAWVWLKGHRTWVVGEDATPLREVLAELGADGWELVAAVVGEARHGRGGMFALSGAYAPSHWLYFKRPAS